MFGGNKYWLADDSAQDDHFPPVQSRSQVMHLLENKDTRARVAVEDIYFGVLDLC